MYLRLWRRKFDVICGYIIGNCAVTGARAYARLMLQGPRQALILPLLRVALSSRERYRELESQLC